VDCFRRLVRGARCALIAFVSPQSGDHELWTVCLDRRTARAEARRLGERAPIRTLALSVKPCRRGNTEQGAQRERRGQHDVRCDLAAAPDCRANQSARPSPTLGWPAEP
jgi:hypothetical protein